MPDQEDKYLSAAELTKLDVSVLYIEDDEQTRAGINEFLSLRIRDVFIACNGKEGVESYLKYHPDIIITDIRMPVMNGIEMAKQIKALNKDIPFIVTTAYNDVEFLIESIDVGINQFILKPIVGGKLMQAIQKCMRGLTLEQEMINITSMLSQYKKAIDVSGIVLKFDEDYKIDYVNEVYCSLSGYDPGDVLGKEFSLFIYSDDPVKQMKDISEEIKLNQMWKGIIKCRKKDGGVFFINETITPISTFRKDFIEFMSIGFEVTELVQKSEELLHQLYTDMMTGLPNRTKLLADVNKADRPVLILINVDSFQQINDFYGNSIGDFIICEIGKRLEALLPSDKYRLYKMTADEYAILIDKEISPKELDPFIKITRIEVNEKPFVYEGTSIPITVAIGIAMGKEILDENLKDGKWHSLALNADMALKKAKKMQKHFIIYDESMQITKEYENNLKWTTKLKEAIKDNRIIPYFQPIQNNHTNKIEKYECLIRMIDSDGQIKSPVFFLDLAKKSKLYHDLTKIMIQKSIEVFKNTDFEFSINLSVDDIIDEETFDFIRSILKINSDVSHRLVFEVLESEGIENYEEVKKFIKEVKNLNCKIAVDDFGSGYSNFSHILRLNVDYIKIDASIIKTIHQDLNTQIVTQTIVEFSKKLGIQTIAEFVHSEEVYHKLLELGVDYSQGYYFGEPKNCLTT